MNVPLEKASLVYATILEEIRSVASRFRRVVVAFSGGMDSTVALFLTLEALGRSRVCAVTVDWGPYLPEKARENIAFFVAHFGVEHVYIPGQSALEDVARGGPSCNLCTKRAKLGRIREHFGEGTLIIGGANKSDSWGHRGMKFLGDTFSPLFDLTKDDIALLASYLGIPIRRIGENRVREGCYLKHLLKPLAVPAYHGKAVVEANALLLRLLDEVAYPRDIANVVVIGPLAENIALVNVAPLPDASLRERIVRHLSTIPELSQVVIVDAPLALFVRANPGIYRNDLSRFWLAQGRIQPEFAFPVTCVFLPSSNRRLRTFQVVAYRVGES
ncbi:MAG: 7-cyano-7-deazaguanine synthase [Candidatus Caldatribacterium sp.]|uniref:7-cyano-7-deazaguanine synthase n=1 Tax=Candidatus Caldatribacterium sp. TaxID=2282143 RepID=UPI0029921D89|nr:7-cyano-7-deazaguanine synthase [Candidatus Caldatribacterium sp.]MCX7729593.1 7-cyano-7-deazaguanine synthase [Candidatus Caldatribacterium sp.]MDW8081695.1 7-cyano-7-deazaguanine synthase [Candidatus Calescibacterium sp.]